MRKFLPKLVILAILLLGGVAFFVLSGEKESQERQAFQAESPQRYEELLGILLETEQGILKDSQNQDAWVTKGWVHEEFQEYDLALLAYQKALDVSEISQIALINMASIYKRQGKYDLAENSYQTFIRLFPYSAQGYWNLTELYSTGKSGTLADVLSLLEQGVELTEDENLKKELERLLAL